MGTEVTFGVGAGLQMGGGVDYGYHGLEGDAEDVEQLDSFATMRYLFPGEGTRVYLGGRAGVSKQAAALNAEDVKRDGFGFGPTAGVIIPLGGGGLEFAGHLLFLSFGNQEVEATAQSGTEANGALLLLRVGLVFGF